MRIVTKGNTGTGVRREKIGGLKPKASLFTGLAEMAIPTDQSVGKYHHPELFQMIS